MDESKLADLFRDAVRDAPPATFDSDDVLGAARRADARRRSALVGGSSLAVVIVAVGLVIGFLNLGHTGSSELNTATPPVASSAPARPFDAQTGHARANGRDFPGSPPLQGGGTPGEAGPDAGTAPSGCGPTDGELADALAGELPSAGVTTPAPAPLTCPTGARAASFLVHDGTSAGRISVVLATAGHEPVIPNGGAASTVRTASGRQLTVLSQPVAGSPAAPYRGSLAGLAQRLAGRF